jgi:hypothetical protein
MTRAGSGFGGEISGSGKKVRLRPDPDPQHWPKGCPLVCQCGQRQKGPAPTGFGSIRIRNTGQKAAPWYVNVSSLLKMFQRLLVTLWVICQEVSEGIGNPLENSLQAVKSVCALNNS